MTAVFFEAPHRIKQSLTDISKILVNRPITIHREISKINEELVISPNTANIGPVMELGEFVIVVGKAIIEQQNTDSYSVQVSAAIKMFDCLTNNECFSETDALKLVSMATTLDPKVVRKAAKKAKIERKRQEQSLS